MNNISTSIQNMKEVFLNAADSFFSTFAGYIPNVIGAIIILLVGLGVASLLRRATEKVLDWTGFEEATDTAELNGYIKKIGFKKSLATLIAAFVYWVVLLISITAAFETLGLQMVVLTLRDLIAYLPNVIMAAATVVLAILLGRFVRRFIATSLEQLEISFGKIVASIAEGVIVLFGATIAASQLGLDITIITANITIIVAGIVALLVVSMGFGSRTAAGNLINGYYTRQLFKKGDTVILGGVKGKVVETNTVAVVLETEEGSVVIPNEIALKNGSLKGHTGA